MPLYIPIEEEDIFHLRIVLDSYLSDLRMEISSTDRVEYRRMLRNREAALERTLSRLAPAEEQTPLNA